MFVTPILDALVSQSGRFDMELPINEYSNNSFAPMNQFLTLVHDQVSHSGLVLQGCNSGQMCGNT